MSSKEVLKQLAEYTKLNIEKKPKRGRNAFDILFGFKNYGAGKTITRNVWKKYYQKPGQCDCFWIVTRVRHKTRVCFYLYLLFIMLYGILIIKILNLLGSLF